MTPPKKENHCLLCGTPLTSGRKYCGERNYESTCATCGESFLQKCQKRTTSYCGKSCQNRNPAVVERANASRKALGYLEENARASQQKVKERYGVENISQLPSVKAKKASRPQGFARPEQQVLFKEKWGVDNASQLAFVKEKKRLKALERYGVDNVSKAEEVKELIRTTTQKHFGVPSVLSLQENQKKSTLTNKYRISKVNKVFQQKLQNKLGVTFAFEVETGPTFLADLGYENLRIDINPTISHNSTTSYVHATGMCKTLDCAKVGHKVRGPLYHQKRALLAEEAGLMLMQYFDWYDEDIFISMVASKLKLSPRTVYARKTTLREVPQREANAFLKEHHLLGGTRGQTVCVGLFLGEELLHVQTYGKARMRSDVEWEALRSASKKYTHIPGAFSKCESYFLEHYKPRSMVSYVDLATSQGGSEALLPGWRYSHLSKPEGHWVLYHPLPTLEERSLPRFLKDSSVRRLSADRLLGFAPGTFYPKTDKEGCPITNDAILLAEGYVKVYDCGRRVFLYEEPSLTPTSLDKITPTA